MDTRLKIRLSHVARRVRSLHLGWSLATIWLASAIAALFLGRAKANGALQNDDVHWWWIGCSAGAALIAWIWVATRQRNLNLVAQQVEKKFPSLNQTLVTAANIRPENGRFGFLQRSVIAQAVRHDVTHQWKSMTSAVSVAFGWLVNVPTLILMTMAGIALWKTPMGEKAVASIKESIRSSELLPPTISPGNTEIERGTSLIVTARFDGQMPEEVWLLRTPNGVERFADSDPANADLDAAQGTGPLRIMMRQSLNDPVFAAYLYDVREPLEYRVAYDSSQTENFQVEVFEYPALVRSDAILEYPTYTNLTPRTVVDTRRVTAAKGTSLTWQLHLNKPVASAMLIPQSESTKEASLADQLTASESVSQSTIPNNAIVLEPSSQDGKVVSAKIELQETQTWQLKLLDLEGRENPIAVSLRAKVLPNKESTIRLTAGGDAQVSPLQEFDIEATIKDDFAVRAAGIGYQFGGGDIVEIETELESDGGKQAAVAHQVDFEALGAAPNELLSYYVWAEDQDDAGNPRRVMSDMFFAEVRPFEEIYREGESPDQQQQRQQQQQQQQQQGNEQTEELLELQKQIVVGTWNLLRQAADAKLPGRLGPDIVLLGESQQTALGLLEEKAGEVEGDEATRFVESARTNMNSAIELLGNAATSLAKSDLQKALSREQAAYQDLLKLQAREFEISRQRQQQSSSSRSQRSQRRQQQIDQLRLENEENRYENERIAQEEQSEEQTEMRQIMSRLRELAARQEDLNEQLRELEAALQAAETQEQREELQRQLERLREQQQQMLEDSDELQEQIESSENEAIQDTQQQMDEARENIQQTNEALRQGNTSQALASGNRAQENLEELKEEVRKQAANQFSETMQDMKSQAAELEQRQQSIVDKLDEKDAEPTAGLRSDTPETDNLSEQLKQQQQQLDELLEQMQQTVVDAEETEPLLAQKLYDSYRRTRQEKADERLELTERLLERNFEPQARQMAEQSRDDLNNLRQEIDEAAEAVLGSEVDALRLALDQLESLSDQIDSEMEQVGGRPTRSGESQENPSSNGDASEGGQPGSRSPQENGETSASESENENTDRQGGERQQTDPNGARNTDESTDAENTTPANSDTRENSDRNNERSEEGTPSNSQQQNQEPNASGEQGSNGDSQSEQNPQQQSSAGENRDQSSQQGSQEQSSQQQGSQQQQGSGQSQQQQQQQQGRGAQGNSETDGRRNEPSQDQSPRSLRPQPEESNQTDSPGNPNSSFQAGGGNARPLTGDDFREWSDRLRDVEELVSDPQLRWEATQIRQSAREIRSKHATDPKWSEVEDLVAKPLRDLQRKVSDELMRRVAEKTEIVPIDRDPVPTEYSRSVQQYYENLGIGL